MTAMNTDTPSTPAPAAKAAPAATGVRAGKPVGREATETFGWWHAHKWLLLRRFVQLGILALFIGSPMLTTWLKDRYDVSDFHLIQGNLSSSLILDTVPLTDPFIATQTLLSGQAPYKTLLIGSGIVLAFYLLLGGRLFCSWVCPMNMVTDAAAWLRRTLGIKGNKAPAASTRYWLLLFVLLGTAFTGTMVWEWINPVSMLHRALIFGGVLAWGIVIGVFLYDLLIASHGWCGHLCPHGAFFGVLGRVGLLRVKADKRADCDDCMDCFGVCPEMQVIRPALKGVGQKHALILDGDCTACGRCIDVCGKQVFRFSTRFDRSEP